jgi:hypothetical protein
MMGSCLDKRGRQSNYKSVHEFFDHTGYFIRQFVCLNKWCFRQQLLVGSA